MMFSFVGSETFFALQKAMQTLNFLLMTKSGLCSHEGLNISRCTYIIHAENHQPVTSYCLATQMTIFDMCEQDKRALLNVLPIKYFPTTAFHKR